MPRVKNRIKKSHSAWLSTVAFYFKQFAGSDFNLYLYEATADIQNTSFVIQNQ